MLLEINTKFDIGDKVCWLQQYEHEKTYGIIIKGKYFLGNGIKYLIELDDETRIWKEERDLYVC